MDDHDRYQNNIQKKGTFKSFDHWWTSGKRFGFVMVIAGLVMQIIPIVFD